MKLVDKVLANTHLETPSLTTLNGSYTTEELLVIVKRYEGMLKQFDIAGKRIALLVPSIKEFIPLVLTINKLGGVAIPLNWQFREEDLLKVLTFIDPHIIFTVDKHSGFDFEQTIKTWSKENNGMTMMYTSSNCEDWRPSFFNGDLKPLEPTAHNFICCTSGSTGTPKGIVFNQGIFDFSYKRIAEVLELSPKDTVLVYTSTSTVFGIKTMTNVIKVGANAIVPTAFDLPTIINEMKNSNCNKIVTTPSLFKAIHTFSKHLSPEVIDNLELVCLTGEKMPDNLLSNFPTMQNCKFVSQYGISEVGAIANSNIRLSDNFTIARGVETKVVDGELYVKTGAFFTAYYSNQQLTNEAFDDGWFKTGDLVEFTSENTFKIVGREKEMIKKGGQQVIPSEVEVTILSLEGVKNVTVLGTPHQVYGEQVVAFVVANNNAPLTSTDVRSHCKGKISAYKIPDKVIFIDELPILQGKVDKRRLKETIMERSN